MAVTISTVLLYLLGWITGAFESVDVLKTQRNSGPEIAR